MSADEIASAPRIWLKAFWGFDPQNEGYLGFTKPGDQKRMIAECRPGDLVLIYGADAAETDKDNRRQALGFLEIEGVPIVDKERLSSFGLERKLENGWRDRWTHAVPVKRAWRINRRIEVGHLAPVTYRHDRARVIASRGELLTPAEALNAIKLPVSAVNVFGEDAVELDARGEFQLEKLFKPSRGLTPSFGEQTSERVDGDHFLYLLKLEGDVSALLGLSQSDVVSRSIVKVGYSNDPKRRLGEHNNALPPAGILKWRLIFTSKAFPDGATAKAAEDKLKLDFDNSFKSLGGEFFFGAEKDMELMFRKTSDVTAFHISATRKMLSK